MLLQSDRPDADLARFLVEHGTDTTAQDKHRRTPLHVLLQSDRLDEDLAQFLVKHGADVTA